MTDYENLLTLLERAGVEFVIVGGVAASAHGSARVTEGLDVVYSRSLRTSNVWLRHCQR